MPTQELGKKQSKVSKSYLKCFGGEKDWVRDPNGKTSPNKGKPNTELYHVKITSMNQISGKFWLIVNAP